MIIYTENWKELIEKLLEIKKNSEDRKWKGKIISTQKMEWTDKLLEIKRIPEGSLI